MEAKKDLEAVEPRAGPPWTDQKRQEYASVCAFLTDLEKRAQVREAGKSHLPSASSQGSPFHLKFSQASSCPLLGGVKWHFLEQAEGKVLAGDHHLGLPSYQSHQEKGKRAQC